MTRRPGYRSLLESGHLARRAEAAARRLASCDLCARYCHVDRAADGAGAACRTGRHAVVGSYGPHFGEEAPLTGYRGSGTIFFVWCNMRCLYCQNWDLSWGGEGREMTAEGLAGLMLALQRQGCHNINLVSPSHVVAQVLEALVIAAAAGLNVPLVWNSGGFDSPEALALLDGVVDIYMPDAKYADAEMGRRASKVREYPDVNQAAMREMHRQVGDLEVDVDGIAVRGLLVRHLVLPNDAAGSDAVMRFLAQEISPDTYVNVMAQYRPCHRAGEVAGLERRPTANEVEAAVATALHHGLHRLDGRRRQRGVANR